MGSFRGGLSMWCFHPHFWEGKKTDLVYLQMPKKRFHYEFSGDVLFIVLFHHGKSPKDDVCSSQSYTISPLVKMKNQLHYSDMKGGEAWEAINGVGWLPSCSEKGREHMKFAAPSPNPFGDVSTLVYSIFLRMSLFLIGLGTFPLGESYNWYETDLR